MNRTQISLTDDERRLLNAAAARTGRSISSLIRESVERVYGAGGSVHEDIDTMRRAFGSWTDGPDTGGERDGAEFVERIRSGRRLPDHR